MSCHDMGMVFHEHDFTPVTSVPAPFLMDMVVLDCLEDRCEHPDLVVYSPRPAARLHMQGRVSCMI